MNKNLHGFWLTVISAIIIVACLIYLKYAKNVDDQQHRTSGKSETNASSPGSVGVATTSVIKSPNPSMLTAGSPVPNRTGTKDEILKQTWAAENEKPQDFYGKILDQNGYPVIGAAATGTLMRINQSGLETNKQFFSTFSDASGNFQFTTLHGWELGVVVKQDGYEMGQGARVYKAPNKENITSESERAVFIMWKRKGAEPMISAHIHAYIPCSGSDIFFSLQNGNKVDSGGDLRVVLIRSPVNIIRGQHFDWTLTLEISDGGLLEEDDAYPNQAPADGYKQTVTFQMLGDTPNWSSELKRSLYFVCRHGHNYGRIDVQLNANFQPPPTAFFADIYNNPNGSRNLEYDPTKKLNLP